MSNLPKGWIETKLGQIVEIVNGGTPSTSNENYWNGNISWITPKDLSKEIKSAVTELLPLENP
jgi:type I restriction enzyme S subunit